MKLSDLLWAALGIGVLYEVHRLVSYVVAPMTHIVISEEPFNGPGDEGFELSEADQEAFRQMTEDIDRLTDGEE